MSGYSVDHEVKQLVTELKRIGEEQQDGTYTTKFITLFKDERCEQIFESLVGTLKAAKKRGIVHFATEFLLQGAHDDVIITLLKEN
ncbi:costars family protein abracl [Anaeramoeba flamelloides]|uniref:Costars family protein abracl n=1 Tax=Anaeramoeba flamelloides TaxID=1746091 RepID=A0AAV7ZS63_9EUKA|nr:costars family protein abracl [Anaeramoeba flamelloides]KAJ3443696.1 costars family protein abracl [Anaeramoeba flamelloides]KAJ6238111.1 costars family protein abracl [Anaeramoeba flamelloides]KAJ6244825.1 costars family protein abracl [Anaeramoeba flamelloides]